MILFVFVVVIWVVGDLVEWLMVMFIGGFLVFGFVFVINFLVYFYLILVFGLVERIIWDVGFYYMVNVVGWLIGMLFLGFSY